jgi:predicted transcriptional regulator
MPHPKLTRLELRVLDALWQKGACSVREIQGTFPRSGRPAYTTVQTTVYRLERKKALRCVKRISNANIFEAVISRADAQRRLVDELLALLGPGSAEVVMAYLKETKRTQSADFADYAEVQNEPTKKARGSRLEARGREVQNEPKPRITRITRMRTKRSQAGGD